MNTPGHYAVHTRHDGGEITIYVYHIDAAGAKRMVMTAERCPESAILSVERRAPPEGLQPEDLEFLRATGWDIIDDPEDEAAYALSERNPDEIVGGFESKTAAVNYLRGRGRSQ